MSPYKESASLWKLCSHSQSSSGRRTKITHSRGMANGPSYRQTLMLFTREKWQAGPETIDRGNAWLNTIYKDNLSTSTSPFAAHKDFEFISRQITYGFYLSDHTILQPVETELVTLAGIMIQNLPLETAWHLRGTRRVGVSMEDVETIQQCVSSGLVFKSPV